MNEYRISFDKNDGPMTALANALKKRIEARWDTAVSFGTPADLTLSYTEGHRFGEICAAESGFLLKGTEAPDLWNMAGVVLRSIPTGGPFKPAPRCGIYKTEKELCGMYFATHFHNFYHSAPLPVIFDYIEDLAFWGLEARAVWFDMHHYTGTDDPEAITMASRLKAILGHAKSLGLKRMMTTLANEGFSTTPEAIKATNAVQNGYYLKPDGFYHTEICPHSEGGMEQILKNRSDMLDLFEDVQPDFFTIWPYDQGGCTCEKCSPWGSNGFLKTAKAEAELIKKRLPNTKIILSTWYFGEFYRGTAEWDGFYDALYRGELDFADMIMADFPAVYPKYPLTHHTPKPLVSFNEFSMYGASPWGGYGANPMPAHIAEQWHDAGQQLSGGMPYSEGIFEDLNKAITLRLFRMGQDPYETVKEYLRYECFLREEDLDKGVELIKAMETGLCRDAFAFQTAEKEVILWDRSKAEEAEKLALELNESLSAEQRENIKWKQIVLRTEIDAELVRNENRITEKALDLFDTVDRLYHTGNSKTAPIRPFCRKQIPVLEAKVANPKWKPNPTFWWEQ